MKIYLLILILVSTIQSCNSNNEREKKTKELLAEMKAKRLKDAPISILDTTGLYLAPIKVTSTRMTSEDYSNRRSIELTYRNISNKIIAGIKFRWRGENIFNEPADMGSPIIKGLGQGFTDDALPSGKSRTSSWNIFSKDGKKVVLAWPYEVVFSDGSKWELGKNEK